MRMFLCMNMLIMVHDMYMINFHIVDTICWLVSLMKMCWSILLMMLCTHKCYDMWSVMLVMILVELVDWVRLWVLLGHCTCWLDRRSWVILLLWLWWNVLLFMLVVIYDLMIELLDYVFNYMTCMLNWLVLMLLFLWCSCIWLNEYA